MAIPLILHKVIIVDGGVIPELSVPAKQALHSFAELNPEYEMRIYTGRDCEEYITQSFGEQELSAYQELNPYSYKADLFKFLVLYNEGGVYSDFRQICLKPFREYIPSDAKWFSTIDTGIKHNTGMACHLLAAAPKQPVFRTAIDMIIANVINRSYTCCMLGVSGPCLLGRAFRRTPPKGPAYIGEFRNPPGETFDHNGESGLIIYKHRKPNGQSYAGSEWGHSDGGGNSYGDLYRQRKVYGEINLTQPRSRMTKSFIFL